VSVCDVCESDLETSPMRRPMPDLGCNAREITKEIRIMDGGV